MANNFDDLAMAVAAFGANNRVILDDLGYPSIMVGVPKDENYIAAIYRSYFLI